MSVTHADPTMIRVAKCKFGPMSRRYHNGKFREVEQYDYCKRGVMARLDNSHSKDYKVDYVSDPLLVIHSDGGMLHSELSHKLKELGMWSDHFSKVDLPRTGVNGEMEWEAGFKTLPQQKNRLDFYKEKLKDENNDDFPFFEAENSIEATV